MVLFELEEKLKTDDGLTDKEAEKYNKLKEEFIYEGFCCILSPFGAKLHLQGV